MSEEQKKKISIANRKFYNTEEGKEKLKEIHKYIKYDNEWLKKMSESHKHYSDDIRKRLSESHKGKVPPNKGIPMSEEQKRKISETKKRNFNKKKQIENNTCE